MSEIQELAKQIAQEEMCIRDSTYSGGNAFLLYFLCEKYNYQTPVFWTFNQARNEGINVLKGAAAFPVYYTLFCADHRCV